MNVCKWSEFALAFYSTNWDCLDLRLHAMGFMGNQEGKTMLTSRSLQSISSISKTDYRIRCVREKSSQLLQFPEASEKEISITVTHNFLSIHKETHFSKALSASHSKMQSGERGKKKKKKKRNVWQHTQSLHTQNSPTSNI